jgi:hypothetical protein
MIDNLKLIENESKISLSNNEWKSFKINFAAIKDIDDLIIILKALNFSLHYVPGQNSIIEIEVNNNKHLFKEIINEHKTN